MKHQQAPAFEHLDFDLKENTMKFHTIMALAITSSLLAGCMGGPSVKRVAWSQRR